LHNLSAQEPAQSQKTLFKVDFFSYSVKFRRGVGKAVEIVPMTKRTVFFLSDRTGITVQVLGNSLLTQFANVEMDRVAVPFVDTPEKMDEVKRRIAGAAEADCLLPIVFSTVVDSALLASLKTCSAPVFDFFDTFIPSLEREFGQASSHSVGRSHGMDDFKTYNRRVEAVNFALAHDDGIGLRTLEKADVVLTGVSRSGKTPTTLYLALQFGVYAANYPLTEEDFSSPRLPKVLEQVRSRLFGLSIEPERLHQLRSERRPGSAYAALSQCRFEIQWAERLFQSEKLPFIKTTTRSIEEIAVAIINSLGLERRAF